MMQVERSARVGFIGLGNIGRPMAERLLEEGWSVDAYDVNPSVTAELEAAGGRVVGSPAEMVDCAVIAVAVPDDDTVTAVLADSGLLAGLSRQAVVLVHSTILPATARHLAERAAATGVDVLDAPVSGGAARARSGDLTIMVGGSAEGLARAGAVLATLATEVVHIGAPGTGAAVKLANQLVMFASLAGVYEAVDFAGVHGAPAEVTLQVLGSSTGDTWVGRNWGFFEALARSYDEAEVAVRYRPWSKDLWDLVQAARTAELSLPVGGLLAQLMADMVETRASDGGTS